MSQTSGDRLQQQPLNVSDDGIEVVQRFYAAYAANDLDGIRATLAGDVAWTIPGHHPLAGTKHGADEIVAYFGQLQRAGFQAEVVALAASGEWVIDLHRGWGGVGEDRIDMRWVLAYRVAAGRIAEVQNFAADQHAADLFFWRVWGDELRPIPDRLRRQDTPSGRG